MHRREFLQASALLLVASTAHGTNPEERIERLNPKIRAIIELNPDRHKATGTPVLLKDNIATADRLHTCAGSAALLHNRYPRDAELVRRLRQSGCLILGKANMTEWANFRSSNSTGGWSARGGQCRNPYDLSRSPSGSSSGCAAAIAAGLVRLAVGTETVGSIVSPAGACGIVGYKPTPGLIPGAGIIPIAESWETAGPMAPTVKEAAWLGSVLAHRDLHSALSPIALKGARIGVVRSLFGFDARVDALIEQQLKVLTGAGARLEDVAIPLWSAYGDAATEVMLYEFKAGLNAFLEQSHGPVRSLSDVIAFNERHPQLEALPQMGQDVLVKANARGPLSETRYLQALETVRKTAHIAALDTVDALVAPTNGPAWKIDFINGDHFEGGSAATAAVGGYPHVTVPAGFVLGLPIGLSFIGRRDRDARLLSLAYAYEQRTRHRKSPRL